MRVQASPIRQWPTARPSPGEELRVMTRGRNPGRRPIMASRDAGILQGACRACRLYGVMQVRRSEAPKHFTLPCRQPNFYTGISSAPHPRWNALESRI